MHKELVKRLKEIEIIYKGNFNLKNTTVSDFYVDVKKAYGHPDALNLISNYLYNHIDKRATCIAASGYGGLSPASVISSKHGLKLTLVRDKSKKYGKCSLIDGYIPSKEDKVAVIDDVFTTGESLRKIVKTLEPANAKIIGFYVIFKRGNTNLDYQLNYLLTPEDLI